MSTNDEDDLFGDNEVHEIESVFEDIYSSEQTLHQELNFSMFAIAIYYIAYFALESSINKHHALDRTSDTNST